MHRASKQAASNGLSELGRLERHLLNDFQHGLPLVPRPYARLAEQLGTTEQAVIETLQQLQQAGYVSRVGAVFRANTIGASTLAAMAVPADRLDAVAALVNGYTEVNHNYEREHHFNLWFVVTAASQQRLTEVLQEIEQRTGLPVLYLPMLEDYHIDLGFELQWT
jgi:DNA-binding Lrp family transcriptional regulator